MSHEAAAEFERLNIERAPAGATRGRAQGEHTTAGVVEKHIDLSKICMLKLKAECERQGLDADPGDIAAEASFAQNASINIGGYSPHMMVMGTTRSMPQVSKLSRVQIKSVLQYTSELYVFDN